MNKNYLHSCGGYAILIACICILWGLVKSDSVVGTGGLILFFIGIAIAGLGTIVDEIKKLQK